MTSFRFFLITGLGVLTFILPRASHAATLDAQALVPGDCIKATDSAVYYLGSDGRRYLFPNEKTYFTWYPDFSNVKTVSDARLGLIPLAHRTANYRPGRKMIKIPEDSKVYVVDRGGIMRQVISEQLAETLYGLNWKNQIDDVPEIWFATYMEGPPILEAKNFSPQDVMTQTPTISHDKFLAKADAIITIGSDPVNGFTPSTLSVKKGMTIVWVNHDTRAHRILGGVGWGSGLIEPGASYEISFDVPGSYDYSDPIYRSMEGNVNVVE